MRILIVEDDQTSRLILKAVLEGAEHEVIQADTTTAALEAIAKTRVDLIVADIGMPGMSGIEMVRHLKDDPRTAETPIVLCTAIAEEETVLEALKLGIGGFVTKPIRHKLLLETIDKVSRKINPPLRSPEKTMRSLKLNQQDYCE